jgi:Domain of unknown function (DUF4263)
VLQKTYQILPAPARPSNEEYLSVARREWSALLASEPDERTVQAFFERNPSFLPGGRTPGNPSGHAPFPCAVISQPVLPGLRSKIPDFMWIAKHSATWFPTLIEIERPTKKLFRADGNPTAEFTQAREQLNDWRTWFAKPENQQLFIATYGIPSNFRLGRNMQLHMFLVYGRRDEFENTPHLSEKRSGLLAGTDEDLMSFDRIAPDELLLDMLTVRAEQPGKFRAISAPPLLELGPASEDWLPWIKGVDGELEKTPLISEDRRRFLISRLPYWRDWALNGRGGIVTGGDRE